MVRFLKYFDLLGSKKILHYYKIMEEFLDFCKFIDEGYISDIVRIE